MERIFSKRLDQWNSQDNRGRLPLVIKGARQVGKTYLVKKWGKEKFNENFVFFDFRENKAIRQVFTESENLSQAIKLLEIIEKKSINKNKGLLFLDEIQDAPNAIPSLKYVRQTFPDLKVITAGSHLGMTKNEEPFPVGEVDFLSMTPLTFAEFLMGANKKLFEYYQELRPLKLKKPIPFSIHTQLLEYVRIYIFTGGMPAALNAFLKKHQDHLVEACNETRAIQLNLIEGYKGDFTKYSGTVNSAHILDVFENVPVQLGRALDENVKKYKFSDTNLTHHRGFASIRGPLTWLSKARLLIKSSIATRAEIPIKAFTEDSRFKLYLFDIGILAAMLDVPANNLLSSQLGSYKGYLIENFLAQELFALGYENLNCWKEGKSELEFILQQSNGLVPIEAKASSKSKRAKSLDAFLGRYPQTHIAFKVTGQNFGIHPNKQIRTIPLYLAGKL